MKMRNQEEIDHIRLAFSSNGTPGLIETLVRKELKKSVEAFDKETLVSFFLDNNCKGAAQLVGIVASREIRSIGTASIDFLGVASGPFSVENAKTLQELRIGSQVCTPLAWLTALSKSFREISPEQREAFDEVCLGLLNFLVYKPAQANSVDSLD